MFSLFKSNAQDLYFGAYEKPELLTKLEQYQTDGDSWESLGFYIRYDYHYSMTPLDVIPFAGTGGDGIHFGFLTDFGQVEQLDNAPIVCVSPSNDPPVKLVANNLQDFLSIVMAIGQAEFLDEGYESEDDIATRLSDWDAVSEQDWQGNPVPQQEIDEAKQKLENTLLDRDVLRDVLMTDMGITPMESIVDYLHQLKKERANEATLQDDYDIGIDFKCGDTDIKPYPYEQKNIAGLKAYLKNATECERIVFYRNATYHYILSYGDDEDIKQVIIKSLQKDGLNRESRILKKAYG